MKRWTHLRRREDWRRKGEGDVYFVFCLVSFLGVVTVLVVIFVDVGLSGLEYS